MKRLGVLLASAFAIALTPLSELAFVLPARAQEAPSENIMRSRAFEAVVWGMPAVNA